MPTKPIPPCRTFGQSTRTRLSQPNSIHPRQPLKIDPDKLQRNLRRGTATGPYGNSTDLLRSYALHVHRQPDGTFTFPYLTTFRQLVQLIINASIPVTIIPSCPPTSSWLFTKTLPNRPNYAQLV